MYQVWKNFRKARSFVRSKNFQIRTRKRMCMLKTKLKTFAEKKLSPIAKTFAHKPAKGRVPMPTAKKVDPLPLRGLREQKIRFELLPLPKPYRGVERRPSDWY